MSGRRGLLSSRRTRRRGGILLEMVLTVPFSLILIFLAIDIGRFVLASSALHDSVSVAARTGARTGVVGGNPTSGGGTPCQGGQAGSMEAPVYNAFCETAGDTPGADLTGFRISLVNSNGASTTSPYCTSDGNFLYVNVEASADFDFLTDTFANTFGFESLTLENRFAQAAERRGMTGAIYAAGTARCEVAR